MDPRLSAFFDILQYDLSFVDELMETYEGEILAIGEFIQKHTNSFYIRNSERNQELIDFLDGNGFKIGERKRIRAFSAQEYIQVWPQYPAPTINWFTTTTTTVETYTSYYYHDEEPYQLVLPSLLSPLAPETIKRIVDAFTRIDLVARPPPKE